MKRVEFKLSMPNRGSWNGKWSGAAKNYAIVKLLRDDVADKLLGKRGANSWYYSFGDGWGASVSARVVPAGERLKKSDGFNGYDWMVTSIIQDGDIYSVLRPKPEQPTEHAK